MGQICRVVWPAAPQRTLMIPLANQNMPMKFTSIGRALSGWISSARPKSVARIPRTKVTQKGTPDRLDFLDGLSTVDIVHKRVVLSQAQQIRDFHPREG
jgi:hypothetical protein